MERTQTMADVFGERVRALRAQRGWSQTVLGERLAAHGQPMSAQTVAKLENGKRPTSVDELAALARVFGTSMADLVGPLDEELGLVEWPSVAAKAIEAAGGPMPYGAHNMLRRWLEGDAGDPLLQALQAQARRIEELEAEKARATAGGSLSPLPLPEKVRPLPEDATPQQVIQVFAEVQAMVEAMAPIVAKFKQAEAEGATDAE